ncbi:alpha-L-rhamnosidase [Desertivibrio insolitus]|uniref:alpha-L-rhamnosidase n=1 Tax=Herbiconiux sp. SYSU D00978 TaxID=2812562 RepID=UPI001F60D256|nr:alpha-L-rhamnosidase [Herbiconiux sp. SYSU D00978]
MFLASADEGSVTDRAEPFELTVERMTEPIGVATATPLFGWKVPASRTQMAYAIEVRSSANDVVWATGRREGSLSVDVNYAGSPLESDTHYSWRVRVWASDGSEAEAASTFETSLLRKHDWKARWLVPHQRRTVVERYTIRQIVDDNAHPIGPPEERLHPPQHVRQELELASAPTRARLYATARGIYTAAINGTEVGDEVLAPGYDAYSQRLSFQCYDVTELLAAGTNVIGMTVADGWFAGRVGITGSSAPYGDELAVIWQLSLSFPDGSHRVVCSGDGAALSHRGGWDYSDLFIGERFDAASEQHGWSTASFKPDGWNAVEVRRDDLDGLVPFAGEPVRRIMELEATVERRGSDSYLVDLQQVIAGRLRLRVRAEVGTVLTIQHSEVILPDGSFFDNIVGPNKDQRDLFVAGGVEVEEFEPTFTFHGFRYAAITATAPFELIDARGIVIASDLRITADLRTSDERINQLHRNVVWSQRGNFLSIPTDCPQRERAGWTGDVQVYAASAATNMDVRAFAERWLANVRAEQAADGSIQPVIPIIPTMLDGGPSDVLAAAGWGDAIALVPWTLYGRYGDRRVLLDNFEAMLRWVNYQQDQASTLPERIAGGSADPASVQRHRKMWNTGLQFGDWLAPSIVAEGGDPVDMAQPHLRSEIVTAMFHAHTTDVVARVASVLGRTQDAERLATRAIDIRAAFIDEYVRDGELPLDLQGLYVLALAFDLVPLNQRDAAVRRLRSLIEARDYHLDTGFLSTPYLLDVLWEAGEKELARTLLWQNSAPSWLYAVDAGATTVWESWEAVAPDGTPSRSSMNHYAFGSVDDWLFRRLGGIEPMLPGYSEVRIAPDVLGPLGSASSWIDTVRGRIAVEWNRDGDEVLLDVRLPPACAATLEVGGHIERIEAGTTHFTRRIVVVPTVPTRRAETA